MIKKKCKTGLNQVNDSYSACNKRKYELKNPIQNLSHCVVLDKKLV